MTTVNKNRAIIIVTIIAAAILFWPCRSTAQDKKWWKPTKNDIWLASAQFVAGGSDGIREQVLYHPNALFRQHPGLNRGWWDSRSSWKNKENTWVAFSDANHTFKVATQTMDILSLGITMFEKRPETRKKTILVAVRKMVIAYVARKAGFHLIYTFHFKN